MGARILKGDCRSVLSGMPDNRFTAVLCDPPYGIGFMGAEWDHGVPSHRLWREVLRVLAPGAVLMAFGGTRTFHRLVCAIEDAGFDIVDCIMWVYGSGFPKSLDVSKAIDKQAGAKQKEIGERSYVGIGPIYHNEPKFGGTTYASGKVYQGAKTVMDTVPTTEAAKTWEGYGTALKPAWEPIIIARKPRDGETFADCAMRYAAGSLWIDGGRVGKHKRWPANLIHDGSPEATALFPQSDGWQGKPRTREIKPGAVAMGGGQINYTYNDKGSAARFFYCAKASRSERTAGLKRKSKHPTVKPLELTKYLATLLRPPEKYLEHEELLVPFSGIGSEMIGAMQAGWKNVMGIEISDEYCKMAEARIRHYQKELKNGQ